MPELDGRVALVTGGSRGIGAAISQELGLAGATVAVNYARDEASAAAVCADIEGAGGAASVITCDLADRSALDACAGASSAIASGTTRLGRVQRKE